MELWKQSQREKPGQVTAASCWPRREYRTWGISALLYIWLWKQESSGLGTAAWFLSGLHVCKVTAPLVRSPWEREIRVTSGVCVCVRDSEEMDREFSDLFSPNSHSHSRAGIILIYSSSLLLWFLVYKWICWVRWLVHLVQQPCLSTSSVLQQQIFRFG